MFQERLRHGGEHDPHYSCGYALAKLLHVDGVDVIGPLPAEIRHITVISCGIPAAAKEPDAARVLVRFLAAPGARAAIERAGLQPA